MGYESFVEGRASGEGLVSQLLEAGFTLEDGDLVSPDGSLTGVHITGPDTLEGNAEWHTCYGFEALIEALHRVRGLDEVELSVVGEEGERDIYVYRFGRWYVLLSLEVCVEESRLGEARETALKALKPFLLPGPSPEF